MTNLVSIPSPDEVRRDGTEAFSEDVPVGLCGVIPESVGLVGKGVGDHLILDAAKFVLVGNWSWTHEACHFLAAYTPLRFNKAKMFWKSINGHLE